MLTTCEVSLDEGLMQPKAVQTTWLSSRCVCAVLRAAIGEPQRAKLPRNCAFGRTLG